MPQFYGQPPTYAAQQPPPGYGQQPQYVQQPQYAPQSAGGTYASRGDRLPAMPGMMQRPTPSPAPVQREPVVRGAAPEMAQTTPPPASSPGWKPIAIPSPSELGIGVHESRPVMAQTITPPASYDFGTVMTWLDTLGVRSCQRTRLAEGYQFVCQLEGNSAPITVQAIQEAEALKQLVAQVTLQKKGLTLAQQ